MKELLQNLAYEENMWVVEDEDGKPHVFDKHGNAKAFAEQDLDGNGTIKKAYNSTRQSVVIKNLVEEIKKIQEHNEYHDTL